MSHDRQVCTFVVEGILFGIDVENVREVLRPQQTTPVPLAPRAVRGLVNLRGQIVTAIDLRVALGFAPRTGAPLASLVTTTDEGILSILVDEVGDLVAVTGKDFEPTPETLAAALRTLVSGIYKLEGQLLLLVDASRLAAVREADGRAVHVTLTAPGEHAS